MPLHLEPVDLSDELERYESVLIVSCPICPPVSLAAETWNKSACAVAIY